MKVFVISRKLLSALGCLVVAVGIFYGDCLTDTGTEPTARNE